MSRHDKYCMNKADPTLENCVVCGLIRRVREDEYDKGYNDGYNKGTKDAEMFYRMNPSIAADNRP